MLIQKIWYTDPQIVDSNFISNIKNGIVNKYSNSMDECGGFIRQITPDKIKVTKITPEYIDSKIKCYVIINADIKMFKSGDDIELKVNRRVMKDIVLGDIMVDGYRVGRGSIKTPNHSIQVGSVLQCKIIRIVFHNGISIYDLSLA